MTLTVPLVDPRFGADSWPGLAGLRGAIWAQTDAGSIVRIDEHSGAVTRVGECRSQLSGRSPTGDGSLWIADPFFGRVWRFDPQPPHRAHDVTTGLNASGIAFGDGGVGSPARSTARWFGSIRPTEHTAALLGRQHAHAVAVSVAVCWSATMGVGRVAGAAGSATHRQAARSTPTRAAG